MPCDQVITNSVTIGTMNAALLKRALYALGARGVYVDSTGAYFTLEGKPCTIRGGKFTVEEGSEHLADTVKRAYSAEAVKYTAQRNGWTIKKVTDFAYEVTK
jgi:hypothetical protein